MCLVYNLYVESLQLPCFTEISTQPQHIRNQLEMSINQLQRLTCYYSSVGSRAASAVGVR